MLPSSALLYRASMTLNVKSNRTSRTAARRPNTGLDVIPLLPLHQRPTAVARRAAHIPARLPALVPPDVLRKTRVLGLDGLRVGHLVVVVPLLAVGAGEGEGARGGGAGGADAVGDGLGVTFVAGNGAGVAAAGEGLGLFEWGGGGEGKEGEGGGGDGVKIHFGLDWIGLV